MMNFAHPAYLWLLLLLIPCVVWYIYSVRRRHASIGLSTTLPFAKIGVSFREILLHALFALQMVVVALLIVILARPQMRDKWSTSSTLGTDIVISMDISSSMLARDFTPNRFEAAKKVASQFVAGRENDNIGIVIFAQESFTGLPMTTDRALVSSYINDIEMGMLADGTAIGDGLGTAINRIKDGKAKSKSIILITDGTNNTGIVTPATAAEIAKKEGIKVYTIGIGTQGTAPYPVENEFGRIEYRNLPVTIDETTLKDIARVTGGKYYRATGNTVLSDIFKEIDSLEKTQMDVRNFSRTEDSYEPLALIALAILILVGVLRQTLLRTIP
ncbi:MAG: VWA domain-containing protein [Clostridium sp.]|nr:VWA domain-containing protein [Clostridium sp.]